MVAVRETGQMTTRSPGFKDGEFQQEFTFRAKVRIAKGAVGQIMRAITEQFRGSIKSNGVKVYQWPPTRVEVTPHGDFHGFEVLLGTGALEPGGSILQHAAPPAGAELRGLPWTRKH